jgi:Ferric reductase like transmembrane component
MRRPYLTEVPPHRNTIRMDGRCSHSLCDVRKFLFPMLDGNSILIAACRLLSSKLNLIRYLTGISHEKLMVFHRWTSWAMFLLALVHTFPFIVVHIKKGDMMLQWRTSVVYWTGVAALTPQAYLNIMSIGVIR